MKIKTIIRSLCIVLLVVGSQLSAQQLIEEPDNKLPQKPVHVDDVSCVADANPNSVACQKIKEDQQDKDNQQHKNSQ